MTARLILTAIVALCACSIAAAIEIELTYTESDPQPTSFYGVIPASANGKFWENGEGILTDRAVAFNVGGDRLITVDYGSDDGEHPDVLYVDLDGDKTIGEGEKFALAPYRQGEGDDASTFFASALIATKVPLSAEAADVPGTAYINIIFIQNEQFCLVCEMAWGHYAGEWKMDGTDHEVRLVDRNANGSFADFAGDNEYDCDQLILIDRKTGTHDMQPLRSKILFKSGAYEVEVLDKGGRLKLEPVETQYGTVTVPDEMTVELYNSEWGARTLTADGDTRLPVGDYWIRTFSRQQNEPFVRCSYRGSENLKVRIEPGAAAKVELETLLHAKVMTKKQRFGNTIRLSLEMATSQGATFRSYTKQGSQGRSALRGVPFFITDKEGNIVVDDMFKFG